MLTDLTIKRTTFADPAKPKKLHDRDGLFLLCRPDGARWWRFAYRVAGVHKTLSMGTYPTVSIAEARRKTSDARQLLRAGQDPGAARKAAKQAQRRGASFRTVGDEWFRKQQISPSTRKKKTWFLDHLIYPAIGDRPIADLTTPDVVACAVHVDETISPECAHRVKQTISQILRYAVATGRAARDVSADGRGALRPVVVTHRPAITDPDQIGALLRAIDGLAGTPIVRTALQVLALTFVRPGELRTMQWADLDLVAAVWRIPAARMKMRMPHLVPLAPQTVRRLTALQPLTGASPWVFPAVRTLERPMSDGTINAALRRLGYAQDEMTGHGFRAMARTILAEVLLIDPFVIEAQLAHATPGPLGSAYARTQYLVQRRTLMAQWADWLDLIRQPARAATA